MSAEGWVIAVVGAVLIVSGLVRVWADRSRLDNDYRGRHRDDEDDSKR
jgi:hypothetical protein